METFSMSRAASAALMALVVLTAACGYSLVGRGSVLPSHIQSVRIPVFTNKTAEPDLESIFTRVVKEEFIRDGRLKVVDSDAADSTIIGEIHSYILRPVAYDTNNNVSQYSVELLVSVAHVETRTEKKLLRQQVETKWQYNVDPSITIAESLRQDAIEKASQKAAESIISLVIESF